MKRVITLLAIALMALTGCKMSNNEESTTVGLLTPFFHVPQKFSGHIKEMTITGYWAVVDGDKITKGKMLTSAELDSLNLVDHFTISFDELGNVLNYSYLDENMKPYLSYSYHIEDGMPVNGSFLEEGVLAYMQRLEYDTLGNLIEIQSVITDNDSVVNYRKFDYSEKGKYSAINIFTGAGELNRYSTYTWNDSDVIIRIENYANSGQFTGGLDNNYHDDGFLKSQTRINADRSTGTLYEFRIEKKDKMGNPVIVVNLHDGEVIFIDEYSYIYY